MKIAVTATSFCKREDLKAFARLKLAKHEIVFADPSQPLSGQSLHGFTAGSDALIVGRERIDSAYLDAVPTVRHISVYGVGTDNIDHDACATRGVSVLVAAGVNADAAAEHTVGLMLAVCRNLALSTTRLRQGQWIKDGGVQLTRRTIAVIGCGHIGGRVAKLLTGFATRLLLVDIIDKTALAESVGGELCSFRDALHQADIVTFHVPLTDSTRHMLSAHEISWLPAGAVVINTSRGQVICQSDLKAALISGHLRGAGLDVFDPEPLDDPELASLDNLVATPHTAGNAWEAVLAMGKAAVTDLAMALSRHDS